MKQLKIKFLFPLIVILIVFFITRWQNLQAIPVFGDEAIYLRWSQLIKNVETLRFVPQSDGKQPLFMWVTAILYKFISDPLVAGRLVSILSGSVIIITLYTFSLLFFNFPIALLTAILYITIPFSFFFDRLALPDNMLSCFGATSMLLALLLAKYPRLDISLLLGFSLGLAWLTKSPAIYFVVLTFITFVMFSKSNLNKIYYPLISSVLAFIIYNLLRLGPQFQQIALRNRDYVWSMSELLKHPLDPMLPHLIDIFHIYNNYLSIPLIFISTVGLIFSSKKTYKNNLLLILFLWWFLPLLANATVAKVFTARYVLFTLPPLIILLSIGLQGFLKTTKVYFKNSILQTIVIFLCFIPNIFWLYRLSTNSFNISLSSTESGYTSSWTSGWGIRDASNYLIKRSLVANVIVGTEGYFGTLPDGLQIYTDSLPQITVFGVGLDINKIPDKLVDARNHNDEVYILFNRSRLKLTPTDFDKLSLIFTYPKPDNDELVLYRLN